MNFPSRMDGMIEASLQTGQLIFSGMCRIKPVAHSPQIL
jgi:hypothetical protein